jgi:hypothetical protein
MWILIAIGVGIVALAHTAQAPFLMERPCRAFRPHAGSLGLKQESRRSEATP